MRRYISFAIAHYRSSEARQLVLSLFLFAWVVFIATPFDLISANPHAKEYSLTSSFYILYSGLSYAAYTAITLLAIYIFNRCYLTHHHKITLPVISSVSVSTWLNSTFLTGVYGEFDGHSALNISSFGILTWLQLVF